MAYIHNPFGTKNTFGAFGDDAANMGMLGQDIVDYTAQAQSADSSSSSGGSWLDALTAGLNTTTQIVKATSGSSSPVMNTGLFAPSAAASSSTSLLIPIALIGAVGLGALLFLRRK